ncbi:hypothetical protein LUZ63_004846 [Rhynchospora breviuscula]|uniref:Uncharacterized protein n=1 Tax=Rhynchospora breviuscula TaxID=2022672 RepID=A0A9Q0CMX1_9POAL|nr:hypothetical protein LUZ63_004846 [Rhynchospora breviuscula]
MATSSSYVDSDEEFIFLKNNISGVVLGSDSEVDEEDESILPKGMFNSDEEGKECHVNLRSGTHIPEREMPKESDKDKQKEKNKTRAKEIEGVAGPSDKSKNNIGDYNVLAHLRKIPALLSVFDALMMSQDLRDLLIHALQNPEKFQAYFAEKSMQEALYIDQTAAITFDDNDLLVGTSEHNRPLYITGITSGSKVNRILVDPGSSINILPLKTLRQLSLNVKHLSKEKISILGFNQNSQKALGSITLSFRFGELDTEIKFYVIDAETSYKALLGRPWLHENYLVPSTLHQCVKYMKDDKQKRIKGDIHPFAVHEIGLSDARYFLKPSPKPESLKKQFSQPQTVEASRVLKEKMMKSLQVAKSINTPSNTYQKPNPVILLESDSDSETIEDEDIDADVADYSSDGSKDLSKPTSLVVEKVPDKHSKDLPPREVNQVKGLHTFFVPPKIEYVSGREVVHKGILFYKAENINPENKDTNPENWNRWLIDDNTEEEMVRVECRGFYGKELMLLFEKAHCFDPITKSRAKLFEKLWNGTSRKVMGADGKMKCTRGLGFVDDFEDRNLSRLYRDFRIIGSRTRSGSSVCDKNESYFSCHMAREELIRDDEQFILVAKNAPKELEEGGQNTIDELLEVNLGTEEEPRPTFINASLSPSRREQLKAFLRQYIDCFAWNYNEMPGLNPEVAVHKLKIDKEAKPIKQAPRRMRVELEEKVTAEVKKLIDA